MKLQLAHFNSFISLVTYFNNDKRCRDFITEQRWGKNVVCPSRGCTHTYVCSNGDNQFKCADCKKRFSYLVGTFSITPNYHFKSGLWQCTLSHPTRRESHHTGCHVTWMLLRNSVVYPS